jgi:phage gp45-like
MQKQIKDSVERTLKKIRSSLMGTITSTLKSNKSVYVKFSDEEEVRDIKVLSPYGFFSLPINGQTGQVIFNNTSKKATLVGVVHDSLPVEINPGEALIYNQSGTYIHIRGSEVYVKGDLRVDGDITHSGNISQGT